MEYQKSSIGFFIAEIVNVIVLAINGFIINTVESDYFFVLYRNPAFNHKSIEFDKFITNFTNLRSNIKKEKPYTCFFTGDFNAHSQIWYPNGKTSHEEDAIENLISTLGMHQIINEQTNLEPNKDPWCIDLIMIDQLNLVLDSGTRPSPDHLCHYQIIHCKANVCCHHRIEHNLFQPK